MENGIKENGIKENGKPLSEKNNSTSYLDKVSRKMCPQLEHFVMLSSESNNDVEEICEQRKQDNLPALIMRWDVIGDIENVEDREKLKSETTFCIKIHSSFTIFDGNYFHLVCRRIQGAIRILYGYFGIFYDET